MVIGQSKGEVPGSHIIYEKRSLNLDEAVIAFFVKRLSSDHCEVLLRPHPVFPFLN